MPTPFELGIQCNEHATQQGAVASALLAGGRDSSPSALCPTVHVRTRTRTSTRVRTCAGTCSTHVHAHRYGVEELRTVILQRKQEQAARERQEKLRQEAYQASLDAKIYSDVL